MEHSSWKVRLEREREQKDIFFQIHPQSPLPAMERGEFKSLDYYPPNLEYRFELELHEHDEKTSMEMAYSGGEGKEFLRWGEFRFKVVGEEQVLQAYKSSPNEGRLFVPFRDATSGRETYGAGRYLDLESGMHLTAEDRWILDFNSAYNPWCAYSDKYTCPFVPPENWLEVPIPAGEKTYKAPKKNSTVHG